MPRYRCIERVCLDIVRVEWGGDWRCPQLDIYFRVTVCFLDCCGCSQQLCCEGCRTVNMPPRRTRDLPRVTLLHEPRIRCRNRAMQVEARVSIE